MTNASNLFHNCKALVNVDLSNAKFERVTNVPYMFWNCYNLITLSNFNTSNVTNMSKMFYTCNNLINVPNFNTSNVTDMSLMFERCNNLTNVPNFDTSNVSNMYFIFSVCHNLISIPNWNTSNVINMGGMFSNCTNLASVSNFNTSRVTNMTWMFSACLISTIPNWDTSNVTDMSYMFSACGYLANVPSFNTSNVVNMSGMFSGCGYLANVPNFNTSNVTDMSLMFSGCEYLASVSNFNTSNVTDMSYMFSGCEYLTNIFNFNTSNVINMDGMFLNCRNLTSIPNFDTINTIKMSNMFYYCSNLHNYPSFNLDNVKEIDRTFGYYMSSFQLIKNIGPLVNLGKAFTYSTNNSFHTLDLYGIDGGTSYGPMTDNALSKLYNLSSAGKNSQQILLQGEAYVEVSQATKTTVTSKGWYLVAMGNVCLTGDMKIQTPDGLIDIKDLKVGDKVYIYNEETERQNTTEINKITKHNNLQIYTFTLSNEEEIKCTARHQFLVNSSHFDEVDEETGEITSVTKTDYMEARLIDLTDKFITKSKEEITITNINISDNEQLVYEINTKTGNNYLLGEDSIIVKQETIEE